MYDSLYKVLCEINVRNCTEKFLPLKKSNFSSILKRRRKRTKREMKRASASFLVSSSSSMRRATSKTTPTTVCSFDGRRRPGRIRSNAVRISSRSRSSRRIEMKRSKTELLDDNKEDDFSAFDDDDSDDDENNSTLLLSKLSVVSLSSFSYFQSACNEAYADVYANPDWQMGVPTEEATPLQNLFGFLFTAFCGWYFWRVVKKRGKRAQTFRVANQLSPEELKEREEERKLKDKKLNASQAFTGGITGIAISAGLYIFASKISSGFDNSSLPESYTARQISITVRTIVEGLVYLATFVYAANGVGLTLLGFKKLKNRYFDISLEDALEESRKEESEDSEQ